MLTVQDDDECLLAAVKAGAQGYLLKSIESCDFLAGNREVLAGEVVLPPSMAAHLLNEFAQQPAQSPIESPKEDHRLTQRELEDLGLVADGATDKEIATQPALGVYTVKSHVQKILSKLPAMNRWEAAGLAEEKGLLED